MKKSFFLIFIIFLAGCATQHVFDEKKANAYLLSHIDRPALIQEALSAGKLAQGMNEEEVTICWGKPDKIINKSMSNKVVTIWRYPEYQVVGNSPRRSILKKTLSKQVTFKDGAVISWMEMNPPSKPD